MSDRIISEKTIYLELIKNLLDINQNHINKTVDFVTTVETKRFQINMVMEYLIPKSQEVFIYRVFNGLYSKFGNAYKFQFHHVLKQMYEIIISQLSLEHYNIETLHKYIEIKVDKDDVLDSSIYLLSEELKKDIPAISVQIIDEIKIILSNF